MKHRKSSARLGRRFVTLALGCVLGVGAMASLGQAASPGTQTAARSEQEVFRIGFHLWKPGKIYDEAIAGIQDGLELEGIRYEAVFLHSDRNKELAEQNLRKLDGMGLDLIYSLSSAGTKIAKRLNLKTPVVATVINHPASLAVEQSDGDSSTVLTGTSYYVDAVKQLALYSDLFPKIDSIGMIYDPKNPAGAHAEEPFMREACGEFGFRFQSIGVTDKAQLANATRQLIDDGAGLIVIPTNRLVYSNLDAVLAVTNPLGVPVVSMNKQGVEYGALAGLFADTYNLGRQAAIMARNILRLGADPREIDFEFIAQPDIILNMTSAGRISYEFPAEVLSAAAIVME